MSELTVEGLRRGPPARSGRWVRLFAATAAGLVVVVFGLRNLPPRHVSFTASSENLQAYDLWEESVRVSAPHAGNPFEGAALRGQFVLKGSNRQWNVDGFCDADDGSVYRIRFMPPTPGDYTYSIEYRQGWSRKAATGVFHVRKGGRRGLIRIDPQNRWHFLWEGTGEHYFFNGTTAYWLIGWQDDEVIRSSLERLHRLKINRVRVTLAGRTDTFFGEPVLPGKNWSPYLTPWSTSRSSRLLHLLGRAGQRSGIRFGRDIFDSLAGFGLAEDLYHPGFDYSRFQVSYWQKFERALRFAQDRDMVFSVVLDMNDSRMHPAPGSADEHRFLRYAVARLGAFSNITWDLGDDFDHYRDDRWAHDTGALIKQWDPYQHLATSHPVDNAHQDRTSAWFDFTSFQEWSRNQHAFMLAQRHEQQRLGRIIPQTNEEYGYEDHYPMWASGPGSESADTLRRMAWGIVMAGGYQTAGETARRGTNVWPDSGGGWMNGRGDDTMTMFQGYRYMVDYFTNFEWWKTEPHDELVSNGSFCLAAPGELYAVYLPHGGSVTIHLVPGSYDVELWNATTGRRSFLPPVIARTSSSTLLAAEGTDDWALLLRKRGSL